VQISGCAWVDSREWASHNATFAGNPAIASYRFKALKVSPGEKHHDIVTKTQSNDGWAWRLTRARGEQVAAHRCCLCFSSASVSGGGRFGYGIVLCGRLTPAFWGIPAHLSSKIIPNGSTWLPNGRCYLALAESLLMQLGNGSGSV
jgi:hypothetical protein